MAEMTYVQYHAWLFVVVSLSLTTLVASLGHTTFPDIQDEYCV
jgi:hypothetical protein